MSEIEESQSKKDARESLEQWARSTFLATLSQKVHYLHGFLTGSHTDREEEHRWLGLVDPAAYVEACMACKQPPVQILYNTLKQKGVLPPMTLPKEAWAYLEMPDITQERLKLLDTVVAREVGQ